MPETALLVIDVQLGAFDGVGCPPISEAAELLASVREILATVREARGRIVHIQHCGSSEEVMREGTPQFEIHPTVAPAEGETVFRKRQSNAFAGTDLAARLRALGVHRLVLAGLQSDQCVYKTAVGALEEGFDVALVADGHRTWPTEEETAAEISARVNAELQAKGASILERRELASVFQGHGS